MGAAYFIVFDKDIDFDTFVNGKALAAEAERVNSALGSAGLALIDDFVSFGAEEKEAMAEEFGADGTPDWYTGEQWFAASQGIEWLVAVRVHIEANGDAVRDGDAVLAELGEYRRVLEQAGAACAKWHLAMDY